MTNIVSFSDLNKDKTDVKELALRRLKNKGGELDATAAGDFDDILNADKENINVQIVNTIDSSIAYTSGQVQSEQVKPDIWNDNGGVRISDAVDAVDSYGGTDADDVKACNRATKQRKTFSLTAAEDVPCSSMQMPVQSDSIDVVGLIGEIADMYQRSSECNSDDISTQEIEVHEDRFDGCKKQSGIVSCAESAMPVSQGLSVQTVDGIACHQQQVDLPHTLDNNDCPLSVIAAACTTALHSVPISMVEALQYRDVPMSSSLTVHSDVRNISSALPTDTCLNTVSLSSDECQLQVSMLPAVTAAHTCVDSTTVAAHTCTESLTDTSVTAHCGEIETSVTDAAAADGTYEGKELCSEEVLSSQVDDSSDVDSESGEFIHSGSLIINTLQIYDI